jgi:hypothetical protein
MHTLQIMLIEADSAEDAIEEVKSRTGLYGETSGPDWSDWHEVGGRWDGYFEGSNVLSYAENVALAEETLKTALTWRGEEIERLKGEADFDKLVELVDNYNAEEPVFDHSVWVARRLTELVMDYWTPDSKVFDLHDYTASLKYFRKRLEENAENQYLVAVDFHF